MRAVTHTHHASNGFMADHQEVIAIRQGASAADWVRHDMPVGAAHTNLKHLHQNVIRLRDRRFWNVFEPGPTLSRTSDDRTHGNQYVISGAARPGTALDRPGLTS